MISSFDLSLDYYRYEGVRTGAEEACHLESWDAVKISCVETTTTLFSREMFEWDFSLEKFIFNGDVIIIIVIIRPTTYIDSLYGGKTGGFLVGISSISEKSINNLRPIRHPLSRSSFRTPTTMGELESFLDCEWLNLIGFIVRQSYLCFFM